MKQLFGYACLIVGIMTGCLYFLFLLEENMNPIVYPVLGLGAIVSILTGIIILYKTK